VTREAVSDAGADRGRGLSLRRTQWSGGEMGEKSSIECMKNHPITENFCRIERIRRIAEKHIKTVSGLRNEFSNECSGVFLVTVTVGHVAPTVTVPSDLGSCVPSERVCGDGV
jgi:hypothetical protein